MQFLVLYLFTTAIAVTFAQVRGNLGGNPCTRQKTCGSCITAEPECAWCSEEGYQGDRCDYKANLFGTTCNHTHIVIPKHEITMNKDRPLSQKGVKQKEYVQIKPQEIHLKLRPKSPYPLKVEFRQAEDYPVDLYYLMDLSKSMEDDKSKLADLGDLLAARMANITSNFRLGFGSFVDKIVMPYVSTVPEKLISPCTGCAAPYGFRNHMSLTKDTEEFAKNVILANVSGNLDAPEGGFDAIMQAIVCKKDIRWRQASRKMLVFSTDSGFHYAGDGKLGGIVKPNDGQCHMDSEGYYTESINQDYPSLSQLNHKIQEHKMNVIFAVTASQVPVYERLSNHLDGSSTGRLENDSSNVVELVKEQYDKITSSVEMRDDAGSNIEVTYYSTCLGKERIKTDTCKGLKVGTSVTFEAEIKVTSCPKDPREWNQTFQIYPVGINEALVVNLEMICDCDCEKPWNEEKDSSKCSLGNGTYECGVCSCYGSRYGPTCECDHKGDSEIGDLAKCTYGNDTLPCSGRGDCICGQCFCTRKVATELAYGKYCECLDFTCDRVDGKICNGPDHGICDCGKCVCFGNWTGPSCSCLNVTHTCIAPNDDEECSGHGVCDCGKCKCDEKGKERYGGTYCEECITCTVDCSIYKSCIQCKVFETGEYSKEECESNCTDHIIIKVEKAEVNDEAVEKSCSFYDDDECKVHFVYKKDDKARDRAVVWVQSTKDCPEPINVLAIVLGVIGGIVAVGLALLLIWKLLTTIHDRREFAKFEKERQMAKWDTGENPIYKQATSTFKNPTYGGKQ